MNKNWKVKTFIICFGTTSFIILSTSNDFFNAMGEINKAFYLLFLFSLILVQSFLILVSFPSWCKNHPLRPKNLLKRIRSLEVQYHAMSLAIYQLRSRGLISEREYNAIQNLENHELFLDNHDEFLRRINERGLI